MLHCSKSHFFEFRLPKTDISTKTSKFIFCTIIKLSLYYNICENVKPLYLWLFGAEWWWGSALWAACCLEWCRADCGWWRGVRCSPGCACGWRSWSREQSSGTGCWTRPSCWSDCGSASPTPEADLMAVSAPPVHTQQHFRLPFLR